MFQSLVPFERRCPRRWSLVAACGFLSLAVLAAGLTLKATAAPAPEPKREDTKKDAPKADPPPVVPTPNLDDLLKGLPPNLDPDQEQLIRKQMEEIRARLRDAMEMQKRLGVVGAAGPFNPVFPAAPSPESGRLGVVVEKPGDTLVDQLELPKDQGLIVREVAPDSAAAKAGLKAHDILLEVDGKPVSSDPAELRKMLVGIKADTPVEAVVMRKGRKETIKGLSLPEARAEAPASPALPNFPQFNIPNGDGAFVTTSRNNDEFTTRRQEPGVILTVKGKVVDGKARVSEIVVQEPTGVNKYDAVDKAPEKYQDKLKGLVEMSEKGTVHTESKTP